ncbi:glycoside hydrolase family 88 protein [Mucilaginibacter sabulilitoris]|uniref:Glycoside hydrolase family 88 protein n=1 Tax=Mucilaginibacter sabulilitoris TaxID=1173583 RepID=A0ABZ0TGB8_9SPHI|nr:glycoside hydrolase family 88 protein [Mucilaginibacter sabulilitoris]WPU91992.1 glycoside hydrolase family 88 protein [Mucilaginibacter sabulilitoris]
MRTKYFITFFVLNLLAFNAFSQTDVAQAFSFAQKQMALMLKEVDSIKKADPDKSMLVSPRTLSADGKLVMVASKDWCSGFFPGELWFLYEYSKDKTWMELAKKFSANIEKEKTNGITHDMGFKVYNSIGNGYRLTNDSHYKEVIIEAAKTLSTRFNPVVGSIKSWDNRPQWKFPVIIDNMLNLELLFEATRLTGDSSYFKIAVAHANTAMKNHFRADYSSYHVVDYDPETGKVLHKQTHQGYADESAWARGQAWGLYGYTMCYRETHNKVYLQQAEHIARFIFSNPNLPADLVPYWDYNDPAIPNVPRDVSAAAITASALYELSTYSKNGKDYRSKADKIINILSTRYEAPAGSNMGFLLLHSTGHKPNHSEIDVPIIYADYYFLEALLRKQRLNKGQQVISHF